MKKLVIFSGLPGTGKSTLSKLYAEKIGAIWLSVDPVEGAMKQSGVKDNYQLGVAAYEVIRTIAHEHLSMDRIIVIDAVNPVETVREMWRKLARHHKIRLDIVECVTRSEVLHQDRIGKRVRNIPGIHEVSWERVQARKIEFEPWQDDRTIIYTDTSIEESFQELLTRLTSDE
jgi:predicted kinase